MFFECPSQPEPVKPTDACFSCGSSGLWGRGLFKVAALLQELRNDLVVLEVALGLLVCGGWGSFLEQGFHRSVEEGRDAERWMG